jgi:hypothetical protein
MPNLLAGFICASVLWVSCTLVAFSSPPKRPAGEAWVVTASDKISSRPMLVRAHVPFRTAAIAQ